jgi:hypothetical protein
MHHFEQNNRHDYTHDICINPDTLYHKQTLLPDNLGKLNMFALF